MTKGRKPGFKHSEETKAKMRGKKKPYSEEHKLNMSKAMTGNKLIDGHRV